MDPALIGAIFANQAALGGAQYTDSALALDFKNGIYRGSGGYVSDVSGLPGYTYSRSGAKSERDAAGTGWVAFSANVPGVVPGLGYWSRASLTNLFLNSAVGVTQGVTVTAQAYTLSFEGTGSITLTGASTAGPLNGTGANNLVSLTFTPTAGTLTCTVAGSCTNVVLVAGSQAGPRITTTGSTATVGADSLVLTNPVSAPFTMVTEFVLPVLTASLLLMGLDDGTTTNRIHLRTAGTGLDTLIVAAGSVNRLLDQTVTISSSAINKAALRVKANGQTTLAFGGALVGAEQGAITLPTSNLLTKASVGAGPGATAMGGYTSRAFLYSGTDSDAQLIARTV